jgi:dethiobiotin synthetase
MFGQIVIHVYNQSMKQRFFITATGTGIGKSFITAALVRQAVAQDRRVMGYKPVISGFDATAPRDSDTGLIATSLGLDLTDATIAHISPWRYAAPLAPSIAARMEKRPLDMNAIIDHSHKMMAGPEDIVVIEGVGGVMVPLTDRHTVLDWMAALDAPVLLVTGSYLGTLSHTLTALAVLQQRGIEVAAIIVNQSTDDDVGLKVTIDELALHTNLRTIPVTRRYDGNYNDVRELRALLT